MYDIFIEGEKVGMGLSKGELNQWLLEVINEVDYESQMNFKEDIGFNHDGNFDDFIYDNDFILPLVIRFGNEHIVIDETEL